MKALRIGVLALTLVLFGCRPSPNPPSESDFFDPTFVPDEPAPERPPDVDFSWWFEDREVVVHPASESIDDEFWYDWEGRHHRVASTGTATREEIREEHLRFVNTPGIFGSLTASVDEKERRAQAHSVSYRRFNEDTWIALGSPFDHDVVHVFQAPVYIGPDLPVDVAQVTYVLEHFVFAVSPRSNVDVIFAPDAVRAGQTGVIPDPYASLFESTSGRLIYPIEITFLYPTYREAIVTVYAIVSSGVGNLTRWFYPRDAGILEYREEVGRE